jgi:hypothetical protein
MVYNIVPTINTIIISRVITSLGNISIYFE